LSPHVNVPYDVLREHLGLIKKHNLNLEIFFSAGNLDSLSASAVSELKGLLDYGPSISIHAPYMDLSPGAVDRKVREITRERFSQALDVAEALGPKVIVFHSGYEKWKYAHKVDIWLEGSLGMWPEFIERASAMGSRIAIENVFDDEPGNLRLLMERLGSESVGICFDTGHFNLFAKDPLAHWLEELGPYIIELHLHDNDKGYDSHQAIGEGSFDFDELFRTLRGRKILYTVEAHDPESVMKSIERLAEYHYRLLS
jgi:sugar phosphate isomerase/epimerase